MKSRNIIIIALLTAADIMAAVPVRWTVDVSRVQPITLDAYHGEALELEATMVDRGAPLAVGVNTATFLWQTNGMGNAWWRTNATCTAGGTVTATFLPAMDPGADRLKFFINVSSGRGANYRAAGTIVMRNSPGANPETAELPQPGGTLDISQVVVENAPWPTMTAVDAAISSAVASATNAIVIPPAADLTGYALTADVATMISTAIAGIEHPPPDLSAYCTIAAAQVLCNSVSNALQAAIAGIQIPSLAGYATETYVQSALQNVQPSVDLSGYATKAYADSVASNAVAGIQIPSMAGYATEAYVQSALQNVQPSVDLSGYATKAYADSVASNAVAGVQVPSLSGYATESYVSQALAAYIPTIDLSGYATKEYAAQMATNALSGYATESFVAASMAGIATEQYVNTKILAGSANTDPNGVTRLWSPDGGSFVDGTGVCWQVTFQYSPWVIDYGLEGALGIEWRDDLDGWSVYIVGDATGRVGTDPEALEISQFSMLAEITNYDERVILANWEILREDWKAHRTLVPITNVVGRVALTNDMPTAADMGSINDLRTTVNAWQTYWDGDDVRVTVTNYYGSTGMPHLYLEEKMPADEDHAEPWFKTVWDEMTRWTAFLADYQNVTNHIERDLADRAWGVYDSSTGADSPDGLLQISHEQTMIAAGLAYQKTVTTGGGELWVLTVTDPAIVGGQNENGYFKIADGDGNELFKIVKGDKRTVGATAGGIVVDASYVTIPYAVAAEEHPTVYMTTDLKDGEWTEPSGQTWTGSSGAWSVRIAKPNGPKAFFKATYETGGETYISNAAPLSVQSGILCTDGLHKVRPVWHTGNSITWEVVQ